jgi:EAL domain-containing protein (putative c-di-GMP-specific phosphodiesterase class I)/GGDEF domain-containing protein
MPNEEARLDALRQLNLLDTPPSETFDRITRMAAQIFDLPIAAVSLTDSDRQWFKSRVGVDHMSIPREQAPCAQVAEQAGTLVVPDLLADACYADSPLAKSGVRFYAGVPLVTGHGFGLGALCVLGTKPRTVSVPEMDALRDLASMVMAQIELQHAFGRIDPLSGLSNRSQFLEDLDDHARDTPGAGRLAVLVDIARGDQIDHGIRVLGSDFIDGIVQDAARTIRSLLGPQRTAYHVAATQFAFLAPEGAEERAYLATIEALLPKLRQDPRVRFTMRLAIGIAPFVLGETSASDVLRAAFSAAQDARAAQRAVALYSPASDGAHARRFRLLNDFGAALASPDQLRLVYQPRIDLRTGRCVGVEALLRWRHPVLGDVSPAEFMPVIERAASIRPATAWVLDRALGQLAAWNVGENIQLSVNVSAANLEEADFAERVQSYLHKHRIRPARLEIEVTESAVMRHAGQALVQLRTVEQTGVRIAIDDFGTGYSSLAYLQRLPAHVVKIDQSFIRDLAAGGERERTLVRSMIGLSHGLGYRVVAEGIETAEVAELLADMGCDEAQGYHFARPLVPAAFARWLRADGVGMQAA